MVFKMKKFLLLFIFCLLFAPFSLAQEQRQKIIFDFLPENESIEKADETDFSIYDQIELVLDNYHYFEQNFPGDKIDGDILPAVMQKYPDLSETEQEEKADDIRARVKFYRYLKNKYAEIKEKLLVPPPPPLQVEEDEYDLPKKWEYVDTGSDKPLIIHDFKKVLSYGSNPRDFEAMELYYKKKMQREREDLQGFFRLSALVDELEWSKLFFYGIVYDNPFTGKKGIGVWQKSDYADLRLVSNEVSINADTVQAIFDFKIKKGYMLLWSVEKNIMPPQFEFAGSENVENAEILWPMPTRVIDNTDDNIIGYIGDFALPVLVTLKDKTQPMKLKAQVKANICGENQCHPVEFEPELSLPVGDDYLKSGLSSFIERTYNNLPKSHSDVISLKKAVVDTDANGAQTLRIVLQTNKSPEKVKIFVDSKDDILLTRPKITLNDDEIIARLKVKNEKENIIGKEFTLTVGINAFDTLRKQIIPEKASIFDTNKPTLSIMLIIMAFAGGVILNLMPCVFPVLSLKFLTLTRYGAMEEKAIRKSFAYTALGIMVAFVLLTALLCSLKAADVAIGWGMQFQNPYFLVAMAIVMVFFMAQIFGLIDIKTPEFILKRLKNKDPRQDNFINILAGLFIVLVATPCTAPYLGTTLGFALAGTMRDIIILLPTVGFGLAIPYLLLAVHPNLGELMPKPGAWMQKLSAFMILMLVLTIVWLLSILQAQTDWCTVLWVEAGLVFFMLMFYMRRKILDSIENQNEDLAVRQSAKKLVRRVISVLLLMVTIGCLYQADKAFKIHMAEVALTREVKIDRAQIDAYLKEGNIVIVRVGADWCLTCKFNDVTVFDNSKIEELVKFYKVKYIDVDWTDYDRKVLEFMRQFGRSGLPFYIIFSRSVPDGMVLPEILTEDELTKVIKGFTD